MPSSVNVARVLQSTLLHLEQSEELKANDPILVDLKGSIIRTLAELEVAKGDRSPQSEIAKAVEAPDDGDGSEALQAVA
jgi:hypothetical protein